MLMYCGEFYQNVPYSPLQKNIDFGRSNCALYCVSDCESLTQTQNDQHLLYESSSKLKIEYVLLSLYSV